MTYIPTEEETHDGFRRYVIEGESDGTPDPSPEEVAAAYARLRHRIRRWTAVRLLAVVALLFAATSGLACGGEAAIPTESVVLVQLRGVGFRCPKIYAFGPFPTVQDAVEYRKLVEDPLREGADSWNVVRLQAPVTLEE